MKWIEIIELRAARNTMKQLEKRLQEFKAQVTKTMEDGSIKMYNRMMIDNDFSVHLFHDSNSADNSGSLLGIRLVSALQSYGLVSHSIWIEKQKDLST